jgi:Rrf2 family transcriptional regulator, nitric oxide-sensitive transcriptional repressor
MSKIINISDAASIAIHSIAIIAASRTQINIQQIAAMTGFSKNHLSKVMQRLVKSNIIKSVRGPKGGFILACDSKKTTLLDIYELIEGSIQEHHCSARSKDCVFMDCIFAGMPQKLSDEFKNYLKATSIHQVAKIKL